MMEKCKTVCFSGHRPEKLPQSEQELAMLRDKIFKEVEKAIADGLIPL